MRCIYKCSNSCANVRNNFFTQHERKEQEIREEYQNEMALKEKELQELLNQQKEVIIAPV